METLTQPLNKEAGDRIAHLDGRQGARGFSGLTVGRAESVALGCRHGGAFAHGPGARFVDRELRDAGQPMSASKRRMPRVEPARSRARPTGSLGAVIASSQPTQQMLRSLHLTVVVGVTRLAVAVPADWFPPIGSRRFGISRCRCGGGCPEPS